MVHQRSLLACVLPQYHLQSRLKKMGGGMVGPHPPTEGNVDGG